MRVILRVKERADGYNNWYNWRVRRVIKIKNPYKNRGLIGLNGGPDGTRTRDLRRDRPAF